MSSPVPLDTLSGLLKASAGGDKRSFETFYEATAFEALALATQLAFERREELLAESYLQAWRDAHRFDPERESAFDWLLAIVRQHARMPSKIPDRSSADQPIFDAVHDVAKGMHKASVTDLVTLPQLSCGNL